MDSIITHWLSILSDKPIRCAPIIRGDAGGHGDGHVHTVQLHQMRDASAISIKESGEHSSWVL